MGKAMEYVEVEPPKVAEHESRAAAFRASLDAPGWHAGPWQEPWPTVICPAQRREPEPCDCGFVGEWQTRFVFSGEVPVHLAWQERCPGCGDIESFDDQGHYAAERGPDAEVRYLGSED